MNATSKLFRSDLVLLFAATMVAGGAAANLLEMDDASRRLRAAKLMETAGILADELVKKFDAADEGKKP